MAWQRIGGTPHTPIVRDTETGQTLRYNGLRWRPVEPEPAEVGPPPDDRPDNSSFGDAIGAGTLGLRGAFDDAIAGGLQAAGLEGPAAGFRQSAENLYQRGQEAYTPEVSRYEDIRTDAGIGALMSDIGEYSESMIGQSLPYMAPTLAGGALGAVVGGPVGAFLGATAASTPMFTGMNVREQIDQGAAPEDVAFGRAAVVGAGQASLDAVITRFFPGLSQAASGRIAREALRRGGGAASTEAITEVAQEYAQMAQARPELLRGEGFTDDDQSVLINAAIGGGMMGGPIGAIGGGIDAARFRGREETDADTDTDSDSTEDQGQQDQDDLRRESALAGIDDQTLINLAEDFNAARMSGNPSYDPDQHAAVNEELTERRYTPDNSMSFDLQTGQIRAGGVTAPDGIGGIQSLAGEAGVSQARGQSVNANEDTSALPDAGMGAEGADAGTGDAPQQDDIDYFEDTQGRGVATFGQTQEVSAAGTMDTSGLPSDIFDLDADSLDGDADTDSDVDADEPGDRRGLSDGPPAPVSGEPLQRVGARAVQEIADRAAQDSAPLSANDIRRIAREETGQDVPTNSGDFKQFEEAVEGAIVNNARELVAQSNDPASTYDELVRRYRKQPGLRLRSNDSIARQAYSTPAPLAYVASRLANVTRDMAVLEPTAGTGMLTMEAAPENVTAYELDPDRAAMLRAQGIDVVEGNAIEGGMDAWGDTPIQPNSKDVVITNPPFGKGGGATETEIFEVRNERGAETIKSAARDHIIAAKSLQEMKDDGRAVLIMGAPASRKKGAGREAYRNNSNAAFARGLYHNYNVTDHFTVGGNLYDRQGTSFPVDVFVVNGRRSDADKAGSLYSKPLPNAQEPAYIDSWEQLRSKIDGTEVQDGGMGAAGNQPNPDGSGDGQQPRPNAAGGDAREDSRPDASGGQSSQGGRGGRGGGSRVPRGDGPRADGADQQDGPSGDAGSGPGGSAQRPSDGGGRVSDGDRGNQDRGEAGGTGPAGDADGADAKVDQKTAGDIFDEIWDAETPAEKDKSAGDIFDEIWDAETPQENAPGGQRRPSGPQTVGGAAQNVAANAAKTASEIGDAFLALLENDGTTLGSGPVFTDEQYQKAKPLFMQAYRSFKDTVSSVADLVRAIINAIKQQVGSDAARLKAAMDKMRPLAKRFTEEVGAKIDGGMTLEQAVNSLEANTETELKAERKGDIETEGQKTYDTRSRTAFSVGSLVPRNIADAMQRAMDGLDAYVQDRGFAGIDEYVADRLGYSADFLLNGSNDRPAPFSGEQVDALGLAIREVEQGRGFIIGDQTGVGKGRFVAGMLRFARLQGKAPVFVTKDPGLYVDMMRDLEDIGELGFAPFPTNSDLSGKSALAYNMGGSEKEIRSLPGQKHKEAVEFIRENGRLPTKAEVYGGEPKGRARQIYDALPDQFTGLFTTYAQISPLGETRQNPRYEALGALADSGNVMFVMDESHMAGGPADGKSPRDDDKPSRAEYFRDLINRASANGGGVVYSSATYAKTPSIMSLYSATNMKLAVDDPSRLGPAIEAGGVPLQTVVANMLAEEGQYTRRERSFAGVDIESGARKYGGTPEQINKLAKSLRAMFEFDQAMEDVRAEYATEWASRNPGATPVTDDGAIADGGLNGDTFTSYIHNITGQAFVGMKIDELVDRSVEALQSGEKLVLAVDKTNEAILRGFVEASGMEPGADLSNFTFAVALGRYVERIRSIRPKVDPFRDKSPRYNEVIPDGDIARLGGQGTLNQLRKLESDIAEADFSDIPMSPLDAVLDALRDRGYSVGEITGRTVTAQGGKVTRRENTQSAKVAAMKGFNNGEIDVLLINQSGSTGFSLHASEKFKDQRPRRMIVAEAPQEINTLMQMLGRIHRTGQVQNPRFTFAWSNAPGETKLASRVNKKLQSLAANTTGSAEGGFSVDAPDFLNRYGDEVVASMLANDNDLRNRLGMSLAESLTSPPENYATKALGRVVLLDYQEQADFLSTIEQQYNEYIERLDELGANKLKSQDYTDAEAAVHSGPVEIEAGTGGSLFQAPLNFEVVKVKRKRPPGTLDEAAKAAGRNLADEFEAMGMDPPSSLADFAFNEAFEARKEKINEAFGERLTDYMMAAQAAADEAVSEAQRLQDALRAGGNDAPSRKQVDKAVERAVSLQSRVNQIREQAADAEYRFGYDTMEYEPGRFVSISYTVGGEGDSEIVTETGVITGVDYNGATKDPVAGSNFKLRVMTTRTNAQLDIPYSAIKSGRYAVNLIDDYDGERRFAEADPTETTELRAFFTGNVLRGFSSLGRKGNIAQVGMANGEVRTGILMPHNFDIAAEIDRLPVTADTNQQVLDFVGRIERMAEDGTNAAPILVSNDNNVRLVLDPRQKSVSILVRRVGGRAYTTDAVARIVKPTNPGTAFAGRSGPNLSATIGSNKLGQVLDAWSVEGGPKPSFGTTDMKHIMEQITGNSLRERLGLRGPSQSASRDTQDQYRLGTTDKMSGPAMMRGRLALEVKAIVDQMTGGKAGVEVNDIIYGEGAALEKSGALDAARQKVLGKYNPLTSMIEVALEGGEASISAVHEAFHFLQDKGLVPKQDRDILRKNKDRLRQVARREGYSDAQVKRMTQTELEAVGAQAWKRGESSGMLPAHRRLAKAFWDTVERLRNVLRGMGFRAMSDIYADAYSGRFAKNTPAPGSDAQYAALAEPIYRIGRNDPSAAPLSAQAQQVFGQIIDMGDQRSARERLRDGLKDWKGKTLSRIREGFSDLYEPLRFREANMQGVVGDATESAWKKMAMTRNLPSVMNHILHHGPVKVVDGWFQSDARRFNGKGLDHIIRGLAQEGLLDHWKVMRVAQRAKRLASETNQGTGVPARRRGQSREQLVTPEQIAIIEREIANLSAEKRARLKELDAQFNKFNDAMIQVAVDAGILKPDLAEKFRKDADYIPFYRVMDADDDLGGLIRSPNGNIRGPFTRLMGSERKILDPLEGIINNYTRMMDASYKNMARQQAVKLLTETGEISPKAQGPAAADMDAYLERQISRMEEEIPNFRFDALDASTQEALSEIIKRETPPPGANTFSVLMNGKRRFFTVHDPALLHAIGVVGPAPIEGWLRVLGFPRRVLTKLVTTDPAFMLRNAVRDTVSAWVTGEADKFIPAARVIQDGIKAARNDPLTLEIMAAGAGAGGHYNITAENVRKQSERLRADKRRSFIQSVLMRGEQVYASWEGVGRATELANRRQIYERVIAQGGSHAEAAFLAMDLINFTARGKWRAVQVMNELIPFLNPRIQGLDKLARTVGREGYALKFGKVGPALIKLSLLAAGGAALALMNADNPEYQELEDWERNMYWNFWMGGRQFRIAKPFEVGALAGGMGERVVDAVIGADDMGDYLNYWRTSVSDTFGMNPITNIQAIRPILEIGYNKSFFTDRPIENLGMQRLRVEDRYRENTSDTMIALSDMIDGAFGLSPVRLESLWRSYFGTIGTYGLLAADSATRMIARTPAPPADGFLDRVPIAGPIMEKITRAFLADDGGVNSRYVTEFYKIGDEMDRFAGSLRQAQDDGNAQEISDIIEEAGVALQFRDVFRQYENRFRDLYDTLRQIRYSETLSREEKQARIEAVSNQITRTSRQLVQAYNRAAAAN